MSEQPLQLRDELGPRAREVFNEHTRGRAPGPRVLYHYTSVVGLEGILASESLWATDVRYLNDSSELRLATELAVEALNHEEESWKGTCEAFWATLQTMLSEVGGLEVYAFSLSEHRDQLSQWRGYCPPGAGYAVGVDMHSLLPLLNEHNFLIAPCIYSPDIQRRLVQAMIADVKAEFEEALTGGAVEDEATLQHFATQFYVYFIGMAPLIKHHTFSEEAEWRAANSVVGADGERAKTRVGRAMLIPYYEFMLRTPNHVCSISEIVVGPTPLSELALIATRQRILRAKIKVELLAASEIPYRQV